MRWDGLIHICTACVSGKRDTRWELARIGSDSSLLENLSIHPGQRIVAQSTDADSILGDAFRTTLVRSRYGDIHGRLTMTRH